MDTGTIFTKTDKGHEEIDKRTPISISNTVPHSYWWMEKTRSRRCSEKFRAMASRCWKTYCGMDLLCRLAAAVPVELRAVPQNRYPGQRPVPPAPLPVSTLRSRSETPSSLSSRRLGLEVNRWQSPLKVAERKRILRVMRSERGTSFPKWGGNARRRNFGRKPVCLASKFDLGSARQIKPSAEAIAPMKPDSRNMPTIAMPANIVASDGCMPINRVAPR